MITNKDIEQYKHLVYKIVNKYRDRTFKYKSHIDWDEMEQVGLIALYKALKNYKPELNVAFLTYASTAIWRAIYRQELFDRVLENETDISEVIDYMADDTTEQVDTTITNEMFKTKVIAIVNRLNIMPRNKKIVIDRLNGKTNPEIAKEYNITPQAVSLIYIKNIERIKNILTGGQDANRE